MSTERHRAPWTSDELQQLQKMFDEGVGISEMAVHLQRSELAIINQVKGMYRRVRTPKECKVECKCPQCQGLNGIYVGAVMIPDILILFV